MEIILLIIIATVLGFVLLMLGPLIGGVIAFGIVVGCLFKGIYLLTDIHKRLKSVIPLKDNVDIAIERHLMEKQNEAK